MRRSWPDPYRHVDLAVGRGQTYTWSYPHVATHTHTHTHTHTPHTHTHDHVVLAVLSVLLFYSIVVVLLRCALACYSHWQFCSPPQPRLPPFSQQRLYHHTLGTSDSHDDGGSRRDWRCTNRCVRPLDSWHRAKHACQASACSSRSLCLFSDASSVYCVRSLSPITSFVAVQALARRWLSRCRLSRRSRALRPRAFAL
jgi:hypothetical protein